LVQVVGPTDGWILQRLARRLAAKLPYAELVPWQPRPTPGVLLAYYVNYALYQGPSGLVDVGFFTHLDEEQQFLERARRMDFCVSMSRLYADWLLAQGVRHVAHIPMGFDVYRCRARLVLGVIGRLEHPRKGRRLVERLCQLPFVEIVATEGQIPEEHLREVYQRVDYVLIPATVEGGPMCLLEGLAMGKPAIAPEGVGLVPELPPSEHLLRYPAGDVEALVRLVTDCFERKLRPRRLVQDRTWDRWAEAHHRLFQKLLAERGHPLPKPAPGFRFGLLGELEVPWGADVEGLEVALDRVGAHLFYGEHGLARAILEETAARYPFARTLLDTIPGKELAAASLLPASSQDRQASACAGRKGQVA
jgi:glycosyltransferase involved in cell wall biosynthesis